MSSSLAIFLLMAGAGIVSALLSAVTLLTIELNPGHNSPHFIIPYLNVLTRLGVFLVVDAAHDPVDPSEAKRLLHGLVV